MAEVSLAFAEGVAGEGVDFGGHGVLLKQKNRWNQRKVGLNSN
jgi:hypothetical protein